MRQLFIFLLFIPSVALSIEFEKCKTLTVYEHSTVMEYSNMIDKESRFKLKSQQMIEYDLADQRAKNYWQLYKKCVHHQLDSQKL